MAQHGRAPDRDSLTTKPLSRAVVREQQRRARQQGVGMQLTSESVSGSEAGLRPMDPEAGRLARRLAQLLTDIACGTAVDGPLGGHDMSPNSEQSSDRHARSLKENVR